MRAACTEPLDAGRAVGYTFGVPPASSVPSPARVKGRTIVLASAALIAVIAVTAVALPLWQARHHRPAGLDDYGVVPAFTLTDDRGAPFTDAALRGKVSVVNFIFTRCETACPVSSMKMRRIQEETAETPQLQLLSFSVDPDYDTPPRLAAYAQRFNADPGRWRFVTGDAAAVRKVVTDAMMISMDRDGSTQPGGAPNIVHEPHFLLIDRDLHIVGLYDSTDPVRLERLVRDARDLAR